MATVLGANQYGKAENRVVRIVRDTARHEIRDLNVSTSLRGAFADAHTTGDQALVLPTDTQKNTAFAYAKIHGRPARGERQPVPLHRLPADQGRRLRPRVPRRGRRPGHPSYGARAARAADPARRRRGAVRPADVARRGLHGAVGRAGRRRRGRQHRLGRRREPEGPPGRRRGGGRPARGAARVVRRRRRHPDRRRADPHRDRAPPRGGPAAAAGRDDAAVRLAADPQRRHARRQPRHRLADRRRAPDPARPRGRGGARLRGRGADRAVGGLLHRLPRVRTPRGRADHGGRRPAAGQRGDGVPQDRQAAVRRHLQRGDRLRAGRRRGHGPQGPHRARRGGGHAGPGAGHRGRAGGPAVGRRDGGGCGRGAGRRGHPDQRPAGQCRLPDRDAGPVAAEAGLGGRRHRRRER